MAKGKDAGPSIKSMTRGEVEWLVRVGDMLEPGQPFLRIGDVTFMQQPKYKAPKITPPLYVANLLLEGTIYSLPPGRPLLVAVHEPEQLPRFEFFMPNSELINFLSKQTEELNSEV